MKMKNIEQKIKDLERFIESPEHFFCIFLDESHTKDRMKLLYDYKLVEALILNHGIFVSYEGDAGAFHYVSEKYTGEFGEVEIIPLNGNIDFAHDENRHLSYKNWKNQIARTAIELLKKSKS